MPDDAVSLLAQAPPSVAKQWAREAGAPSELLVDPPAASSAPAVPPTALAAAWWATPGMISAIAAAGVQQGKDPAEHALLEVDVVNVDWPDESGVNETFRVWFSDGSEAYHKPFDGLDQGVGSDYGHDAPLQPMHEVAAWVLARELGGPWRDLVPPCVIREVEGRLGSLSAGMPGEPRNPLPAVSQETIGAAGFFDALAGQQDRHGGNLLVSGDQMKLIDHGFTFAVPGDGYNLQLLQQYRAFHEPALRPEERDALQRLVASDSLLGMRGLLEPERADALKARAEIMLAYDRVLPGGAF